MPKDYLCNAFLFICILDKDIWCNVFFICIQWRSFYVVIFYKGICDVMHFYIYITFEFFDAICVFNDDVWWLQIWLDVQLKDSQLDLLMTPTSLNGMWPSLAPQILSSMSSFIFHLDIHHYSCPLGWFWVHFLFSLMIMMIFSSYC